MGACSTFGSNNRLKNFYRLALLDRNTRSFSPYKLFSCIFAYNILIVTNNSSEPHRRNGHLPFQENFLDSTWWCVWIVLLFPALPLHLHAQPQSLSQELDTCWILSTNESINNSHCVAAATEWSSLPSTHTSILYTVEEALTTIIQEYGTTFRQPRASATTGNANVFNTYNINSIFKSSYLSSSSSGPPTQSLHRPLILNLFSRFSCQQTSVP